jgi:hypothetical protein
MKSFCSAGYSTQSLSQVTVEKRFSFTIVAALLGTVLFLVNSGKLMADQLISASQVIVVDAPASSESGSDLAAIGGTRAKAIGGTRAKAIGGTRAKAIGGTRAKAIGGTRAKAIGGTRAKAIGGTRAKAIGGTRAKAIGGTRAKAIGGTRAKAIGGTRLLAVGGTPIDSINQARTANTEYGPATPVSFMGEEYSWIVIGPLRDVGPGRASVLGYTLNFDDQIALQSLINDQKMVAVGGRHSDGAVISLVTDDAFVSGMTEVLTAAQVESVDASTGKLTLSSGVTVDYTQLLSDGIPPAVNSGDFVFVQGHLY